MSELEIKDGAVVAKTVVESTALNRLLLRHARKSPAEIAEITGLPKEEVAERLSGLLASRSWRDERMEESLVLQEISELIEDIRSRMQSVRRDEDYATLGRTLLANFKVLLEQADKRKKLTDEEMSRINRAQAMLMVEAINIAMERASLELSKRHPGIDEFEVREVFMEQLPLVIERVEQNLA